MEKFKLRGMQELSFVTDKGDEISGSSIWVSRPQDNVIGERCDKFFVPDTVEFPEQLAIGDMLNIFFNQRGKVIAIHKCTK